MLGETIHAYGRINKSTQESMSNLISLTWKKKALRNIYIFKKPKKETKLPKEIYKTKPEINK